MHDSPERPCLKPALAALIVTMLLMFPAVSLTASGEDTEVTVTRFLDGSDEQTLSFLYSEIGCADLPDIHRNCTILEANVTVTGVPGPVTYDDPMDFSTDTMGDDMWARHEEGTGIFPPTVNVTDNDWAAIGASDIANIKRNDGTYWHTRTPADPTGAPWEYAIQLFHFRHDADNVSDYQISWNGHGTCTANETWEHSVEMYVYHHRWQRWLTYGGYSAESSRDFWLNYTVEDRYGYLSANKSIDVAIVSPHAYSANGSTDYGHIYTDYIGFIARVNTTAVQHAEDVILSVNTQSVRLSTGPLTGSVLVGDAQGLKGMLQTWIDMQPEWAEFVNPTLEFEVDGKTRGKLLVHDLYIRYLTNATVIPNEPPQWVGPQAVDVEEDSGWTSVLDVDAAFTDDHDQGSLRLSIQGVHPTGKLQARIAEPPGGNRTLEVRPAPDAHGDVEVTLQAVDTRGASSVSPILYVHIIPVPDAPELVLPGVLTAMESTPFRAVFGAIDPDLPDDELTFADDSPLFEIDPSTGTIDWTPGPEHVGDHAFTVNVTDRMGLMDEANVTITVRNVNDPPTLTSPTSVDAEEGQEVRYQVTAEDPDLPHGDVLTYSAWCLDLDVQVDAASGLVTMTLPKGLVGDVELFVQVQDAEGKSEQAMVTVHVANVNDPPTMVDPGTLSHTQGETVRYRLQVDDPDLELGVGEALVFTTEGPEWLVASVTGWINFTATQERVGEHSAVYTVTDSGGLWYSVEVTWLVLDVNDGPTITTQVPATVEATEDVEFSLDLEADDPDGDELSWSDDSPLFAIDPSTGAIAFTPGQAQVGTHRITVTVTDGELAASVSFDLAVANVNDRPVIVTVWPSDGTRYAVGDRITLEAQATDEDGDELEYHWMEGAVELGSGSRTELGKLGTGSHLITLVVSDGTDTAERTFEIVVEEDEGGGGGDDGPFLFVMLALGIVTAVLLVVMLVRNMLAKGEDEEQEDM